MTDIDRRTLFKGAVSSLLIGFVVPPRGAAAFALPPRDGAALAPNAFVRIGRDGSVTVISKYLEMGQGIDTGVAMVLAEELDADWNRIRVESAPADLSRYINKAIHSQGTGGSTSMMAGFGQLREAGAAARALLVRAAALDWGVAETELDVARGVISHPLSNREDGFGAFVETARTLPLPDKVRLKDPATFSIIGKPVHRLDSHAKSRGALVYTGDMRLPGMVFALVRRPPRFGATVRSMDDSAARATAGVRRCVTLSTGVAIVAQSRWAAQRGCEALQIEWDESRAERRSSAALFAAFHAALEQPGATVRSVGDFTATAASAARTVRVDYELPYLAHAMMEPLNCLVRLDEGGCELWYGCQFQSGDQANVAKLLGIASDKVVIHTLAAGGSFGRRGSFSSDFVLEAVEIARALPVGTPLLVEWTREDDIAGGCYRPMSAHRLEAALDPAGKPVGWRHRMAVQSIAETIPMPGLVKNGVDPISVRNAVDPPYAVPNMQVELHSPRCGVTVMPWRSVGASYNVFVMEAFVDRLAHETGVDPLAFRLSLLSPDSRFRAVLGEVARRAGWGRNRRRDRAQGIAMASWAGTYIAQIAEVSRTKEGLLKVDRVTCAVDCGQVVNPDLVRGQIEGGVAFGLSAALFGEITLKDGLPEQHNFDGYKVLRITDMPQVDIHILPSDAPPTGVGETAVPATAPAVANAVHALTGTPVTRLPMKDLFAS